MMLFLLLTSLVTLVVGNAMENAMIVSGTTILLWMVFFVENFKRWKKSILVVLFLICFFSFLLGAPLAEMFGFEDSILEKEEKIFMLNILYLTLISLWSGTVVSKKIILVPKYKWQVTLKKNIETFSQNGDKTLEKFSLCLFCIGFPFYTYNIIHKILFISESGYLAYYTSYSGESAIVTYGGIVCMFGYFLFLACCPTRKKAMPVLIVYLIANILSVFSGQRTGMVVGIVFFIYYSVLRHNRDSKEGWIKKKYVLFGAAMIPLMLAFLGYWAFARTDTVDLNMNMADYVGFFISANGSSGVIIAYTDRLCYTLENIGHHSYTFGYLIRLVNNLNFELNSVDLAMSGTSLGAAISYFSNPNIYLLGGGMGTCYIAELWIDFGVTGIVLYNLILGVFLDKVSYLKFKNPIGIMIAFSVIQSLFILPRNEALCMLPFFNSIVFIILLVIALFIRYSKTIIKLI